MIRINLLTEKEDKSGIYLIQGVTYVSAVIALVCGLFFFHGAEVSRLANLESRKQSLETQLITLKKRTAEVENLEEEQKTLEEKLSTIALLKSRKRGPVHVLYEINMAIPEYAWLESVEQTGDRKLLVKGVALDDQTVANFIGTLESSDYFSGIELIETIQTTIEEVKLKEFALAANVTSFVIPGLEVSEDGTIKITSSGEDAEPEVDKE